jgi:hypothetical protein
MPAPSHRFWCELINPADFKRTPVKDPVFRIGRSSKPQLTDGWLHVTHASVSQLHCALIQGDGAGSVVVDLSPSGIFLNGTQMQQRPDLPPSKGTAAALVALTAEAGAPRGDRGVCRWAILQNRDRISLTAGSNSLVFTVQLTAQLGATGAASAPH